MTPRKTILLVHGAAHGAWCWGRVIPLLEELGHRVSAVNLPGRDAGKRSGWRFRLDDYAMAVAEAAQQERQPVVAVGHSMGGQVISAAAEKCPGAFERLVYLAAFLPRSGDSIASLGGEDDDSELKDAVRVSLLKGLVTIDPVASAKVFYGDCAASDIAWANNQLVPEPLRPSLCRVRLSESRMGRVRRSYIRCTKDRALSVKMQERMISRRPCERVASLESSHSPFLSMPDELVRALSDVIDPRPAPRA